MALFSWDDAVYGAGLSAGSEATNLRSYNLSDPILQKPWRSLATTSYFQVVFSMPWNIDLLGLFGTNIGPADQVRHRLYDAGNIVILDDTVSAGVVPGYGMHLYRLPTTLVAAKWRCDITASSRASSGNFDVGRAWAAPVVQPKIGIAPGWSEDQIDKAEKVRGRFSGAVFTGNGPQYRSTEVTFGYLNEADSDALKEMVRAVGQRKQVFFAPFDEDMPTQAILGKFTSISPITEPARTFPRHFSQQFTIEEDL